MKNKRIFIFLISIIIFLGMTIESNAALKANGDAGKTYTLNNWMAEIRKMETTGQNLGLNALIGSDLKDTTESNNLDVHMERNTEYGALAILSASKYGKATKIENGETTTGNRSGVVIKFNVEKVAAANSAVASDNFQKADARYKDVYYATKYEAKPGDALGETKGWYGGTSQWGTARSDTGHQYLDLITMVRANQSSIFSYFFDGCKYNGGDNGVGNNNWSYYSRAVIIVGEGI